MWVQAGEERRDRVDVGLLVKNGAKGLYVPDYARPFMEGGDVKGGWVAGWACKMRKLCAAGRELEQGQGREREQGAAWDGRRGLPYTQPATAGSGPHSCLPTRTSVSLPPTQPQPHLPGTTHTLPLISPPPAGWAYSEALVRILDDYRRRFPWLWAALETEGGGWLPWGGGRSGWAAWCEAQQEVVPSSLCRVTHASRGSVDCSGAHE